MNAPRLNFDGESRSGRLPATAASGSVALNGEPREFYVDSANTGTDSGGDFRKILFLCLRATLKYRWLILTFCGIALVIGFIINFTSTPIYQSTVTIQTDRQAARVVKVDTPQDQDTWGADFRFYQTQYDLLKSRSLAERVASDLDLGAASDFLHPPSTSAWGKLRALIFRSNNSKADEEGSPEARKAMAASIVQGGMSVMPVRDSNLVRISFESPSPEWARRIANGVADSYVSSNLERRYGATAYARKFLQERLDELKLKLEQSEEALVAYAEKKELITAAPSGDKDASRQSLAESDLAALNAALQKVVMDRIHAEQLWEQANKTNGLGLPQILDDKAIQVLLQQRAALTSEYQNKLSMFTPAYPDMRKLKAQIDQINQEIKSATDVIKDSLKARHEAALQQEGMLKNKMDEIKKGVLITRDKEIQYNILKREADTNRILYDGLLQQYKDVGVAGAVGTNNVAVIDRAQASGGPIKPNLQKNLLMALVLGLLAAGAAIILLEIFDDTFKSPEEIEEQTGLSVLGIIPFSEGNVLGDINESKSRPFSEALRSLRTALQ